jgi:hypothetical protein
MDKNALKKLVDECIEGWEAVIATLGPDGLQRPGACGDWRVRDVLAHMTGWERWQILQLRNAFLRGPDPTMEELVGGLPYPEEDHPLTEDERNAIFTEMNAGRPLDDVLADYREVTGMYRGWVDSASQADVDTMIGVKFGNRTQAVFRLDDEPDAAGPETAGNWVSRQFLEHRNEHLDEVRAWMNSRG